MARRKKPNQPQQNRGKGLIRIIAGQWKGRKLPVVRVEGLRPTPDRVRETLFNWLQGSLYQARCLDLFAGSGAIGFEALSRGAKQVVMVEKNNKAAQQLTDNIKLLNTENAILKNTDAYQYLKSETDPFDIIFLDPPFRKGHLEKVLDQIVKQNLLAENGLIYLEQEAENLLDLTQWKLQIHKQTKAGQLDAFLFGLCNHS